MAPKQLHDTASNLEKTPKDEQVGEVQKANPHSLMQSHITILSHCQGRYGTTALTSYYSCFVGNF